MIEKRTEVGAVGSFESASQVACVTPRSQGKPEAGNLGLSSHTFLANQKQYLTPSYYFLLLVFRSLVYDQIYPELEAVCWFTLNCFEVHIQ